MIVVISGGQSGRLLLVSHIHREVWQFAAKLLRMKKRDLTPGQLQPPLAQCAPAVLMVRPAAFGWNAETSDSNRFQARTAPEQPGLAGAALDEFDRVVAALRHAGVTVHVVEDRREPRCPDAVFPNNWVSFHHHGGVVLYPMLAPIRRHERRPDLLQTLVLEGGYSIDRVLDLTHHELEGRFLEGTGSVVFDHAARVAYACL
jgi:hypothetical protein